MVASCVAKINDEHCVADEEEGWRTERKGGGGEGSKSTGKTRCGAEGSKVYLNGRDENKS